MLRFRWCWCRRSPPRPAIRGRERLLLQQPLLLLFASVIDNASVDIGTVSFQARSPATLHLFHEYLFRKRPVPFGLIRNGPISSDAPYATEEHPGPAKGSKLVFLKLLDSVLLPSMRNADAAKSDLMANRFNSS